MNKKGAGFGEVVKRFVSAFVRHLCAVELPLLSSATSRHRVVAPQDFLDLAGREQPADGLVHRLRQYDVIAPCPSAQRNVEARIRQWDDDEAGFATGGPARQRKREEPCRRAEIGRA